MEDFLKLLGIISISSAGIGSILAYIFKRSFDSILKYKLDKQKLEFDKEISSFKVEIERLSFQNQFVFQKLHEERSEVIKTLHEKFFSYWRSNQGFLMGIRDSLDIDKINEFNEYANQKQVELVAYYEKNRLFFTKELLNRFETFMDCIDEVNDDINKLLQRKDGFVLIEKIEISDKEVKLQEMIDKITKKYLSIIFEIEQEFRKMLGVET